MFRKQCDIQNVIYKHCMVHNAAVFGVCVCVCVSRTTTGQWCAVCFLCGTRKSVIMRPERIL